MFKNTLRTTLLAAAMLAGGATQAQPALTEIKVSYQPALYWALPFFVASEKNWWAEVGLKPVFSTFPAGVPQIAAALMLSKAEVHGVVSFYHDFRAAPAGRHVLKLCRAEACQTVGADAVADRIKQALGIDWHETTADGRVTLEPVFCLGLCACAPAAMVDGKLIGRVDEARVDAILAEVTA
mgnify:CR=1 FL=1